MSGRGKKGWNSERKGEERINSWWSRVPRRSHSSFAAQRHLLLE